MCCSAFRAVPGFAAGFGLIFAVAASCHGDEVILDQDFEQAPLGAQLPAGVKDNSDYAGIKCDMAVVETNEPGRGKALQIRVNGFAQIVLCALSW